MLEVMTGSNMTCQSRIPPVCKGVYCDCDMNGDIVECMFAWSKS